MSFDDVVVADDSLAMADCFAETYSRLKRLASRHRSARDGNAGMGTTEIVHELYVRMSQTGKQSFVHPLQFFAYAAQALRSLVVDMARRQNQIKNGAGHVRIAITDPAVGNVHVSPALALSLDAGLRALELRDARAAQVVELHFFAGLDLESIAKLLGVTRRTVDRDWRFARAYLAAHVD